jgi:hypothetical protein
MRNSSRIKSLRILLSFMILHYGEAFVPNIGHPNHAPSQWSSSFFLSAMDSNLELDSLLDMDIVIYSTKGNKDETTLMGALQEDGTLAPLSVWTTEPVFGESMEFLVDEEDRFSLDASKVNLHYRIDQSELSYGSRQCHRGVGNPHGEESELLYYVNQEVIERFEVNIIVKPGLEILW